MKARQEEQAVRSDSRCLGSKVQGSAPVTEMVWWETGQRNIHCPIQIPARLFHSAP